MKDKRKERQTRTQGATFQTREDGEDLRIEGYFAVFGSDYEMWPGVTESIDPHAFDEALADDIRVLVDHDTRLVLGRTAAHTAELRVDAHGLWGSVIVNRDDTDAMNAYARNKRGDVNQASFGFDILDEEKEYRDNGDVHFTIKCVKLYEVSLCTFPAYKETELKARADDVLEIRKRQAELWRNERLSRLKNAGGHKKGECDNA